jgi:hypothetical protein
MNGMVRRCPARRSVGIVIRRKSRSKIGNALVTHRWIQCVVLMLVAVLVCSRVKADVPLSYATIEPQKITMGQSAIMRITSLSPSMGAFTMPVVQGLDFELLGHTNQMEFVNGVSFPSSSVVLRVTAQIAGIYKIPPVTPKSQALILEVVPAAPAAVVPPPPSPSLTARGGPIPPGASAARADGLRLTSDGSAFLRVGVPKRDVFVGESVPVDIELGLRAGFVVGVHGLPALTGAEFTLNNLSQEPQHELRRIDGKPFEVLIWHSIIAAVKPGDYSLSVETPLTVKIRTQSRQESALDDLLGDPFYQNRFGAMVKRDITVMSPATDLKVLPLPPAGRPADFSGAVGDFKVTSELSSHTAAAGEPLTVRMHVIGSGNFDRVDTSMFKRLDQWKTYPPTSTFKKSDVVGYKGEKLFEQPLIAAQAGAQTLPPLTFNYFDPVARRYQTARSSALDVTISSPLANSAPAWQVSAANTANAINLRANHVELPGQTQYLTPGYLRTEFAALCSSLALLLAGGIAIVGSPGHAGLSRASKRQLSLLDAAVRSGDVDRFLEVAQSALRAAFAGRWAIPAESVTAAMLDQKLQDGERDVLPLFIMADAARYSGQSLTAFDFARWHKIVSTALLRPKP